MLDAPSFDVTTMTGLIPTPSFHRATPRMVEPHKRLMAAVLQTVIDDCRGSAYRRAAGYGVADNPRAVRRAIAYITSTDRTWPFSFENLCEALALDAGSLRRDMLGELGAQRRAKLAVAALRSAAAS